MARRGSASSTSGAVTRWISGAGTNVPNARITAPSKDSGWLSDSVIAVARPSAAFTPQAAIAQLRHRSGEVSRTTTAAIRR